MKEIDNVVHETDTETRIYCANCGDEEGETGWAPPEMVLSAGWKKVGSTLVCGDPRCLGAIADLSEEEVDELLTEGATVETLSEEAVAAMPGPVSPQEFDLSAIPEHGGS